MPPQTLPLGDRAFGAGASCKLILRWCEGVPEAPGEGHREAYFEVPVPSSSSPGLHLHPLELPQTTLRKALP